MPILQRLQTRAQVDAAEPGERHREVRVAVGSDGELSDDEVRQVHAPPDNPRHCRGDECFGGGIPRLNVEKRPDFCAMTDAGAGGVAVEREAGKAGALGEVGDDRGRDLARRGGGRRWPRKSIWRKAITMG